MLAIAAVALLAAAPQASYNALQIAPTLPAADGERPATKIAYFFGADVIIGRAGGDFGDLWTFAYELMTRVKDPGVRAAAKAVREAQAAAMLFEKDVLGPSNGLSVYMPRRSMNMEMPAFAKRGYPQTKFAKATGWATLLTALPNRVSTPEVWPAPKAAKRAKATAPAPAAGAPSRG